MGVAQQWRRRLAALANQAPLEAYAEPVAAASSVPGPRSARLAWEALTATVALAGVPDARRILSHAALILATLALRTALAAILAACIRT